MLAFILAIPLRIVRIRLYVFYTILFGLSDVGVDEWSTIVGDNSHRIAKLEDDVIADEVGYNSPGCSLEGYYFDLFGVAFCCSKIHM